MEAIYLPAYLESPEYLRRMGNLSAAVSPKYVDYMYIITSTVSLTCLYGAG